MSEELKKDDNVAWCPQCGDEMVIIQDKLKPREHWTYFCEGCQKKFQFKKLKEGPLERLAALEHEQWIDWSKSISETEKISPERLERWKGLWKPYSELTEEQKEQDRIYAKRIMKLLRLK